MKKLQVLLLSTLVIALLSSSAQRQTLPLSGLLPSDFDARVKGESTHLYVLKNRTGMEVCATDFGARIVSIMIPDRNGVMQDVVLGFDNVKDYIRHPTDFGATIGRFANRIAHGMFTLDETTYHLSLNDNGNTLHGGAEGFQYQVFSAHQKDHLTLQLCYDSKHGEAGFPGNLMLAVTYSLSEDENILNITYQAVTDQKTVVNFTNHSYFNLSGDPRRYSATEQILTLNAEHYLPIDTLFIPLPGEPFSVAGTPMDFRAAKVIGQDIDRADFDAIRNGQGYDHNWVLNHSSNRWAARLYSPASGITLDVFTVEPGIQVYTGNFLDGTLVGKRGVAYSYRSAVCLETQHFPNSPNRPDYPSVILVPNQLFSSTTTYSFSVVQ